ncbi:MAG: translesion error-prone DNA polymerase V autoproteolytic subunit [Cocleimonas sp.]
MSILCGIGGFPSPASEYQQQELSLDELLINHPSSTFLAVIDGNSMVKVGIHDKDIVITDRAEAAKHGDVLIVSFNGEISCKILDKENRLLLSANDDNKPIPINESDEFVIIGVVTSSIRCFKRLTLP